MATTYTNAPTDFDGFGTHTVSIAGTYQGQNVRVVETPDEHVNWQRARYASGMYLSASEVDWTRLAWILDK